MHRPRRLQTQRGLQAQSSPKAIAAPVRTSPFADGSRYHIPVDKILEAIVNIRNTTDTKVVTFFNLTYVDLTLVRIPSVGYIEGAPEPKKMSFQTPECPTWSSIQ